MFKRGKSFIEAKKKVEPAKRHTLKEAVEMKCGVTEWLGESSKGVGVCQG